MEAAAGHVSWPCVYAVSGDGAWAWLCSPLSGVGRSYVENRVAKMKRNRFGRVFLGMVVLGFGLMLAGCPGALAPVMFADEALENAIRAELGLPFGVLSEADLLNLRALDARNMKIRDLSGLERCTRLMWLDLSENNVSNIEALTPLRALTYVNLDKNDVTDIWPLAGLYDLRQLLLFGNPVYDLTPLVANAENGGIGFGTYVALDDEYLPHVEGDTETLAPHVLDALERMAQEGVTVLFPTDSSGSSGSGGTK